MKMKAEIQVILYQPRSPKRASNQQDFSHRVSLGRVSLAAKKRN